MQILNITATGGTTDDAITFTGPVRSFVVKSRTNASFQFRKASAAGTYFTVDAGTSLSIDDSLISGTVGYVRGSSAGQVLEVLAVE